MYLNLALFAGEYDTMPLKESTNEKVSLYIVKYSNMYRIDFETPLILKGGKKCEGLLITEPYPNPEDIFLMQGLFENSTPIKIPMHKIGQIIEALQEIDLRGVSDDEPIPF